MPEPGPEETEELLPAETAAEPAPLDLGAAAPEAEADPAAEEARLDKKYEGKRVHAWVLVRAGKREVDETVFIEPTTARRYPVDASPYQGLECVWNHVNYWVNSQSGTWLGAPGEAVRGIDFDLDDPAKWEACLEVEKIEIPVVEEAEEDELDLQEEEEEEEEEVPAEPEPEARSDAEDAEDAETEADPEADSRSDAEADSSARSDAEAVPVERSAAENPGGPAEDEPSTASEPPPEPENEYLDHDPYRVVVERPPPGCPSSSSRRSNSTRCARAGTRRPSTRSACTSCSRCSGRACAGTAWSSACVSSRTRHA